MMDKEKRMDLHFPDQPSLLLQVSGGPADRGERGEGGFPGGLEFNFAFVRAFVQESVCLSAFPRERK